MSTIKTTHIQHPSASSPNFTLDNSGGVAINGSMTGAGLDHIITQDFNSVSEVSINNAFSSSYDNYRVMILGSGTVSFQFQFRLRSNGVDDSGNNYTFAVGQFSTSYAGQTSGTNTTASNFGNVPSEGGAQFGLSFDIYRPAVSVPTQIISIMVGGNLVFRHAWHYHGLSQSYDGITLLPSNSANITGSMRVYGYKD